MRAWRQRGPIKLQSEATPGASPRDLSDTSSGERAPLGSRRHERPSQRNHPGLSLAFIVHSFNRVSNVDRLAEDLRRFGRQELIVCDDGSLDGSRQRWLTHLVEPSDFMILSNDLHEIRILDRAIQFTSAEIVCLLQDDDILPEDIVWLDAILEQFEKHPDLAIVGGFMGFNSCNKNPIESRDDSIWGDVDFQFVWHVNIGPYFIRKHHYEDLGGWDYSYSDAGEPGIGFDSELCLRAWMSGYKVGYRFVPIKGSADEYALEGGTMLFSKGPRFRNQWRNHRLFHRKYSLYAGRISELVNGSNRSIGRSTVVP